MPIHSIQSPVNAEPSHKFFTEDELRKRGKEYKDQCEAEGKDPFAPKAPEGPKPIKMLKVEPAIKPLPTTDVNVIDPVKPEEPLEPEGLEEEPEEDEDEEDLKVDSFLMRAKSSTDTITPRAAELTKSLLALSAWFNTAEGSKRMSGKIQEFIRPLVEVFGYIPHNGPLFRTFNIKKSAKRPEIGDTVEMVTGLRPVQSWSGKKEATYAFAGNQYPGVTVQLKSSGKELLNTSWLRTVITKIKKYLSSNHNPSLSKALKELQSTIRSAKSSEDEDEVIMLMPERSRVTVLRSWPAFILR